MITINKHLKLIKIISLTALTSTLLIFSFLEITERLLLLPPRSLTNPIFQLVQTRLPLPTIPARLSLESDKLSSVSIGQHPKKDSIRLTMSKLISDLGQAPSKAPTVSGEQFTLVPDDSELVTLGSRRRQSTEQIIPAVLRGSIHQRDINSALDMITCSENIRVTKGGEIHSLQRCKKRICPICSGIEANKWIKRINEAVEFLADDMIDDPNHRDYQSTKYIGIKTTLTYGERCLPEELGDILKAMHKQWSRLLNTKLLKEHAAGAFRATEFLATSADGVVTINPHIHGIILIKVTKLPGLDYIKTIADHIKRYWKSATLNTLRRMKLKRSISSAGQNIEPLSKHTADDLSSWLRYATKGAITDLAEKVKSDDITHQDNELTELWSSVYRATKGIRLISSSGVIAEALAEAKSRRALEKTARKPEDNTESTPTHRWSYPKRRYIPTNEWIQHIDRAPNFFLVNFGYHNSPRCLFDVWRGFREREEIPDERRIREYLKTRRLLPKNKHI